MNEVPGLEQIVSTEGSEKNQEGNTIENPTVIEYKQKIEETLKDIETQWDAYLQSGDFENSEVFHKASHKMAQIEGGMRSDVDFQESKSNFGDLQDYLGRKAAEIKKPLREIKAQLERTAGNGMTNEEFSGLLGEIETIDNNLQNKTQTNESIKSLMERHKNQAKEADKTKIGEIQNRLNQ